MQKNVRPLVVSQSRHRFWWLMPKAFDWLSSSLYIGIFIVAIVPAPARVALWQIPLLVGVLLTLLLIDRLEYWRYGEQVPLRVAVLMARVVCLEKAGRVREQASRVRAEELLAEVERSHRQLQVYAERVAELATTEERNRIAREIHDGLGHALIAITLQLEKALVYQEKQPGVAVQAVSDAKRVAKDALQDVRRSVSVLHNKRESFACTRGITLLVEQLRDNALAVDFEVDGSEERFSNDALMTLYRVAQEGFTNIQKHAQASAVQVRLHFAEEEAHLSICDNGLGFDAEHRLQQPERFDGGYGLQGIQERLALVGGSFQLVSQEGRGTQLLATVTRTGIPTPVHQGLLEHIENE